jgi:S-formylglutathione hydrolase FrmB
MMNQRIAGALLGAVLAYAAAVRPAAAQLTAPPAATVPKGITVQHIKVHGAALEGNLEGNSPDRDVIVVLPPSYEKDRARRYPVIYLLHGYSINAQFMFDFAHVPEAAGDAAAKGAEFIIVVPDSDTRQGGSMYSSSVTTGDFEAFVARDLVNYIDGHYRTRAKRASRGLVGHSMGGYGVWKIAMKYPQMWSSIYAMSACCVPPRTETVEQAKKLSEVPFDQAGKADFGTRAGLASAVAWSPAPDKPPYYADFAYKNGSLDEVVLAKWAANSPLAMVPQYIAALKTMTAIAADVGDMDPLLTGDTGLHDELDRFGIRNEFEVYSGTHTSRVAERFDQAVLPFFAQHLTMK